MKRRNPNEISYSTRDAVLFFTAASLIALICHNYVRSGYTKDVAIEYPQVPEQVKAPTVTCNDQVVKDAIKLARESKEYGIQTSTLDLKEKQVRVLIRPEDNQSSVSVIMNPKNKFPVSENIICKAPKRL